MPIVSCGGANIIPHHWRIAMSIDNGEIAPVITLTPRTELSPEQRDHWWRQLESAERQVEYAKRMLGILAVEKGMNDEPAQ